MRAKGGAYNARHARTHTAAPAVNSGHAASPGDFPAQVLALVRRHGSHSLAYSALQPGMRYFMRGGGCIAYRSWLGQRCVLGDPIAPPEQVDALLDAFLQGGPALFMQVQRSTADRLRARGYRVTPVGVENEIDTAAFSLAGRSKRDLRHYRNKAAHANLHVQELNDSEATRHSLRPVSDAWLPHKSWFAHELEFLARPYVPHPESGVRLFAATASGHCVAFTVLDPIYRDGAVEGYTVTILRHLPDAPEGACDAINLHVIDRLREEGIPTLSLGVSPFHRIAELARAEGHGAWPVYLVFHALARWGNPIYHFRGLSFHKSRYRAREIPVYTAVPGPFSLLPLFASAKVCRMI